MIICGLKLFSFCGKTIADIFTFHDEWLHVETRKWDWIRKTPLDIHATDCDIYTKGPVLDTIFEAALRREASNWNQGL